MAIDPDANGAAHRIGQQPWTEALGRAGYTAKGVVYVIIGILAVQAAWAGGQTTGAQGAIRKIAEQPFGQVLLIITALGLLCYGVWRLIHATLDPANEGSDGEGVPKRIGFAASGIIYIALAFFAAKLALASGGGSGGSSNQAMSAKLMSAPLGLVLVGLVGIIIICVGCYHFYRAYNCSFMQKYRGEMSARQREWARRIGRWGLSSRGVTFVLIGIFFVQAALTADPGQAKGLSAAFETLLQQPYGRWLLAAVALGFICYGIYCFSYARYRRFETV